MSLRLRTVGAAPTPEWRDPCQCGRPPPVGESSLPCTAQPKRLASRAIACAEMTSGRRCYGSKCTGRSGRTSRIAKPERTVSGKCAIWSRISFASCFPYWMSDSRRLSVRSIFPQKRSSPVHNSFDRCAWLERKILIDERCCNAIPLRAGCGTSASRVFRGKRSGTHTEYRAMLPLTDADIGTLWRAVGIVSHFARIPRSAFAGTSAYERSRS